MPHAYSRDLRVRVVAAFDEGATYVDVAEQFKVSISSVERWVKERDREGRLEQRGHAGGAPRALNAEQRAVLAELHGPNCDQTYAELIERLEARIGKRISTATLSRELSEMGFSRKKNAKSVRARHEAGPSRAKDLR